MQAVHGEKDYEEPPGSIDLARLVRLILDGRRQILLIASSLAMLTLGLLFLLPNVYTSRASFIPPSSASSSSSAMLAQLSSLGGGLLGGGLTKSQGDLCVGILKSDAVQNDLIKKFSLTDTFHEKRQSLLRKELASLSVFEVDPKSTIITISVTNRDPKLAHDLVDGYLNELRETNERLALMDSSQRRLFYSEQLAHEKDLLAAAEVELRKSEEKSGLIAPAGQTAERIQNESSLRAQLTAREVQLASLLQNATEQNVDVIQIRSQIAALRQHLAQIQNGSGGGEVPASNRLPEAQLDYIRKAREVKYHETLFEILSRQYEAARLDESHEAPLIQVLDVASVPDTKSGPHRALFTVLSFALGLVTGTAFVWARDTYPRFSQRVIHSLKPPKDEVQNVS